MMDFRSKWSNVNLESEKNDEKCKSTCEFNECLFSWYESVYSDDCSFSHHVDELPIISFFSKSLVHKHKVLFKPICIGMPSCRNHENEASKWKGKTY
jgi:hypothetical protein